MIIILSLVMIFIGGLSLAFSWRAIIKDLNKALRNTR